MIKGIFGALENIKKRNADRNENREKDDRLRFQLVVFNFVASSNGRLTLSMTFVEWNQLFASDCLS